MSHAIRDLSAHRISYHIILLSNEYSIGLANQVFKMSTTCLPVAQLEPTSTALVIDQLIYNIVTTFPP